MGEISTQNVNQVSPSRALSGNSLEPAKRLKAKARARNVPREVGRKHFHCFLRHKDDSGGPWYGSMDEKSRGSRVPMCIWDSVCWISGCLGACELGNFPGFS